MPCACLPTTPGPQAPVASPRVDWGDASVLPTFYGREREQAQLTQWIIQDRCQVVSILGMGGIGKSTLAITTMHQLTTTVGTAACPCPFDVVIFRSLHDAPSCEALLAECLQVFSPQPSCEMPIGQAEGVVPTEQRLRLSSGQVQGTVPTEQRLSL